MSKCKDCGEADVRTEDGRHDWDVCGKHLLRQRDEARAEVARLEERLQFDPGGSARIDELEYAVTLLRAEVDHWKGAAREHAENLTKMQAERDHLEVLWKAEMEHANKWAARARKAEADFSYMNRIRDHLQGQVLELQRDRETACENTPTKGCECPGCCTARERAERGEA